MFRFNYGRFAGQTLDEVASTTEGLLYLDHMADSKSFVGDAIREYISDPNVAREIELAIEEAKSHNG